ncbi:MAG: TIGR04282 family arsenosugar biosynthesis glycosyltransferase [Bryobacteraceae bacterium]
MLFAKAPHPGRVKTRLCGADAEAAADFHVAFVSDMLEMLLGLQEEIGIELHTDEPTAAWSGFDVSRALQVEGDLGVRMFAALDRALAAGHPQAAILGSDAPTLPANHVHSLLASPADVALGPSEDGGYYGIACRRVHARMFDRVEWSSPRACEQTAAAARACGLTVALGPEWFDVDEPADLERLRQSPLLPRHTGAKVK